MGKFQIFLLTFIVTLGVSSAADCRLNFTALCECYRPPKWNMQYLNECNKFLPTKTRGLCFFYRNGTNYYSTNTTSPRRGSSNSTDTRKKYDVYKRIFSNYANYSECVLRASPGISLGSNYEIDKSQMSFVIEMLINDTSLTEISWKKAYQESLEFCIDYVIQFRNKKNGFSPATAFLYCQFIKALVYHDFTMAVKTFECYKTYSYNRDCSDTLLNNGLSVTA